MPTDYGYTGQRSDSATGLSYYGSRYYDPTVGQFTSADTVMDGLNRYGYVHGNPTSDTDPTGHIASCTSVITNVADIVSGTPTSPVDVAGNLGQCGMDGAFGVSNTKAEGVIGKQVWDKVLATYKRSGNYTYLTDEGATWFKSHASGGAISKAYASNLWPPSKMLPGRTTTAAEVVIKSAQNVLKTPKHVQSAKPSITRLKKTVNGKNASLGKWGKVGKALGWAGALISFGISALDDYSTHGDVGRAAIVGGVHAGFSMAGAWVGGALGGMAGGLCGPAAVVCSPLFSFAGASVGAWAGDQAATWAIMLPKN